MVLQQKNRDGLTGIVLLAAALLMGGCSKPFHLWQADVSSTPKPLSFDVGKLASERVAILAPASYADLQGYLPVVLHGLTAACSKVSPPIRTISLHETMNTLSRQGHLSDYREDAPDYAPSNILDRQRLGRIHNALAAKYVLQPGLAEIAESTEDRFEFAGFKVMKARVQRMHLWLRLWDAETGEFLWEGAGEGTVAAAMFEDRSSIPIHDVAGWLWMLMLQETLLAGKTRAALTSEEYIFSGSNSATAADASSH